MLRKAVETNDGDEAGEESVYNQEETVSQSVSHLQLVVTTEESLVSLEVQKARDSASREEVIAPLSDQQPTQYYITKVGGTPKVSKSGFFSCCCPCGDVEDSKENDLAVSGRHSIQSC